MVEKGSDCPRGKRQFISKQAAKESQPGRGVWLTAYRCVWCDCWHVGNRRGLNSKARAGRKRKARG